MEWEIPYEYYSSSLFYVRLMEYFVFETWSVIRLTKYVQSGKLKGSLGHSIDEYHRVKFPFPFFLSFYDSLDWVRGIDYDLFNPLYILLEGPNTSSRCVGP